MLYPKDLAARARPVLRALHANSEHVEASALVSRDGIAIASVLTVNADAMRFGAMCASLLVLAGRAASEVDRGELRQLILDGTLGPMLLTQAGAVGVLAVAAAPGGNLGRLILETRRTAAEIGAMATSTNQI